MNFADDKPLPAVGAYWIDEADYPAVLKIFDDGNTLPRTWKEWLKIAEEMEKGLKAYGHPVMRVRIDPATFPAWCAGAFAIAGLSRSIRSEGLYSPLHFSIMRSAATGLSRHRMAAP